MCELEYLGSRLEVGVVVHDRHPVLSREYRRQQIDDVHGSMPTRASQEALRIECPLPGTIVSRQVLVRLTAVGPHLLVADDGRFGAGPLRGRHSKSDCDGSFTLTTGERVTRRGRGSGARRRTRWPPHATSDRPW